MNRWRLQEKNKIDDSNIEDPVRDLASGADAEISELANQVSWNGVRLRCGKLTISF